VEKFLKIVALRRLSPDLRMFVDDMAGRLEGKGLGNTAECILIGFEEIESSGLAPRIVPMGVCFAVEILSTSTLLEYVAMELVEFDDGPLNQS
jgi:hypothetical protein